MTRIVWSPQALADLESIREYIAHDSTRYAQLVVRRLVAAVERLEAFPQSGRVVPERDVEHLREIIAKPYRIVYRLRPELVEIVTVFMGLAPIPRCSVKATPLNAVLGVPTMALERRRVSALGRSSS